MSKRIQPEWNPPDGFHTGLRLYNSLTRQKEEFIPQNGNRVSWYSCGPTVYDASHMGHARSYITFDILRRVLTDYFHLDVTYVMNITDVDDKIIKRARRNYLFQNYVETYHSQAVIIQDAQAVLEYSHANIDFDQYVAFTNALSTIVNSLGEEGVDNTKEKIADSVNNLLKAIREPFSDYLDDDYGNTVNDNSIFSDLPRRWEEEFHKDMDALNILRPNVLTRVSEYVPQITEYIQKIIDNDLAYESNGSIYFDVEKFNKQPNHFYAKLVPEAYGDTQSLQEGEGELVADSKEKRSPIDFALWKASKPGEPWWDSPWGKGRPGWHIECSVMASSIFGSSIDIHTGGVDLKFPHHDNELAQAEAYYNNNNWIRYFLHSGHLTIAGCKMSKSLKNFITIQDALMKYSARQLRFAFLLHSWRDTLDYSDNTMDMAITYEKFLNEFFLNVKDFTRGMNTKEISAVFKTWTDQEFSLNSKFDETKSAVHTALCDNVDTRSTLEAIRNCVTQCNIYMKNCGSDGANLVLLTDIAKYITKMLQIFGTIPPGDSIGFPVSLDKNSQQTVEETLMPYLNILSEFRDKVRVDAREGDCQKILEACDKLRDEILPNVGVRLEDREGKAAAVKLVDRETLLKEREEKKRIEAEKAAEKERKLAVQAEKEALKKIPPSELFRKETDKYSQFDDKGLPTHDATGKEISKGLYKKLQKIQAQHERKHQEYLQSLQNGDP